jgi:hypothetical protein
MGYFKEERPKIRMATKFILHCNRNFWVIKSPNNPDPNELKQLMLKDIKTIVSCVQCEMPSGESRDDYYGISQRNLSYLFLVLKASGYANERQDREIDQTLNMDEETVEKFITNALEKDFLQVYLCNFGYESQEISENLLQVFNKGVTKFVFNFDFVKHRQDNEYSDFHKYSLERSKKQKDKQIDIDLVNSYIEALIDKTTS